MSKNDYDEEEKKERNEEIVKRIGITILVVIALIILFFLLKGCTRGNNNSNKPDKTGNKDLTSILLKAGKDYYGMNDESLPKIYGECSSVNLLTLSQEGLIDRSLYTSCSDDSTYVKVCKLESGKYQYVPFIYCTNDKTEDKYAGWNDGIESDVIADSTDVKFLFQAQYLETGANQLGSLEELWQDEIKYKNYKIVSTTKYYRYRDLQYIWNVSTSKYYPGDVTEAAKVKEYYISSPASGYTNKSNQNNSVAKYFSTTEKKEYWVNSEGVKRVAIVAPDSEYIYRDNPITMTRYSKRTWTEVSKPTTAAPQEWWYCASSNDVSQIVSSSPCDVQTNNPNHTITIKHIYSCDGGITEVGQNSVCYRCTAGGALKTTKDSCGSYSSWSPWTETACDLTESDLCESRTITAYNWYKLVDGDRKYYPSGSSTAQGEKTYYDSVPAAGLIRDESTITIGWKWYKKEEKQTSEYLTTAPQGNATKTDKSKWTEFTNWSTSKPASLGSAGTREIQTKNKIKLRQITASGENWKVFNSEYLTLDELLAQLHSKGYNVNSLEELNLSGDLKYSVKLMIRNKEVK